MEKDGALGEGAGLVPPVVLGGSPPVLVATEYIEGGLILRASRPFLRLVERGTGSNRVVADEVEMVGGVTVNP